VITGEVLIVDARLLVAIDLHEKLSALGLRVCAHVDCADDALTAAAEHRPGVALVSTDLPDAVLLSRRLRAERNVPTVFVADAGGAALYAKLDAAEPVAVLRLPCESGELRAVLEATSSRRDAEHRLDEERALARAHRVESLARLAGGVAHDFSNLLTPILANVAMVRRRIGAEDPNHALLSDAESAARKAAELCQQMLAYAGQAPLARSRVDLSRLVREMQRLLRVTVPPRALFRLSADERVPPTLCDRAQLRQAVLNLVTNAAESLPDGRGTVSVRVFAEAPADDGRARAVIEVRDDGDGMTPETLARLMEPFYSTKAPGRGLGLAATDGVVRSHGGTMEIRSERGRGTVVRVVLPTVEGSAEHIAAPNTVTPRFVASGVVVVADDEEMIRRVARRFLASSGFDVVEAANGAEALERARAAGPLLRMVILDVMMPVMDGVEAFGHLAEFTSVPVVLVTGYAEHEVRAQLGARLPAGFLFKPFDGAALLRVVEQAFRQPLR
jgi:signal transduction histidine kinase